MLHFRLALNTWAILLSLVSLAAAQSTADPPSFTLQVAAFPNVFLAKQYATYLARGGEQAGLCTVELPGQGRWTRVLVGTFPTAEAARRYGEALRQRGLIDDYLVRVERDTKLLDAAKPVTTRDAEAKSNAPVANRPRQQIDIVWNTTPTAARVSATSVSARGGETISPQRTFLPSALRPAIAVSLPVAKKVKLALAPAVDSTSVPRPDPVRMAFNLITGARDRRGGLWVTGDQREGLARLRWIVGSADADLVNIDDYGRVQLDVKRLAEVAAVNRAIQLEAPLAVVDYITANEGLLLLVQLAESKYRYCLHIGRFAQTAGGLVEVGGSVNLDNNYDSRINPYRRSRKKLDSERPPADFDSLVAMNPLAQWFNLRVNSLVPVAHIAFHELAEAHAKLELDLDYLMRGEQPGAHDLALEREVRLKAQRPLSDVVITLGLNRVLKSADELRQVTSHIAGSQR